MHLKLSFSHSALVCTFLYVATTLCTAFFAAEDSASLFFKDNIPDPVTEVQSGSRLVLECEVGGSPSPTIHWLFNGERVQQGYSASVFDDAPSYENSAEAKTPMLGLATTRAKLTIDCVNEAVSGVYTCVADTSTHRIATTTNVKIVPGKAPYLNNCVSKRIGEEEKAARVFMWTAQRVELQGADVQLYCRADGSPRPSLSWYDKDGQPITATTPGYRLLENGDLLIRELSFVRNMGLYRCEVENNNGADSVSTFVYPTMM